MSTNRGLIETARAMRALSGETSAITEGILDMWYRTADALEEALSDLDAAERERDALQARIDEALDHLINEWWESPEFDPVAILSAPTENDTKEMC